VQEGVWQDGEVRHLPDMAWRRADGSADQALRIALKDSTVRGLYDLWL
jgi:hypothetical protein